MKNLLSVIAVSLVLAGCWTDTTPPIIQREQTDVKIPVVKKMKIPAEIMEKVQADLPEFLFPSDAAASSCLSAEGTKRLRAIILTYRNRWDALKVWNDAE